MTITLEMEVVPAPIPRAWIEAANEDAAFIEGVLARHWGSGVRRDVVVTSSWDLLGVVVFVFVPPEHLKEARQLVLLNRNYNGTDIQVEAFPPIPRKREQKKKARLLSCWAPSPSKKRWRRRAMMATMSAWLWPKRSAFS